MSGALFPAVTVILSAATFAGVWTMTDPAAAGAPPVAVVAAPVAAMAGPLVPDRPATRVVRFAPAVVRHRRPAVARRTHPAARPVEAASADVYYPGCHAVRAAGAAPLYRGQPGYRSGMDGDGDGIACEPYRGG